MTNREFIKEVGTRERDRARWVNNLHFDGKHLYSYGRHYPLLVDIGGKWFLNDTGYSTTTARHISQARPYADFVFDLHYHPNGLYYKNKKHPEVVFEAVDNELVQRKIDVEELRSNAHKKEARLQQRIVQLRRGYEFLKDKAGLDERQILLQEKAHLVSQ